MDIRELGQERGLHDDGRLYGHAGCLMPVTEQAGARRRN